MKKALAGVLVAAIVGLSAAVAMAQVPFFQVYFDDASNGSYSETQADCGEAGTSVDLYVVALNFNALMAAVEYRIAFPPGLLFQSDNLAPPDQGGMVSYGDSNNGLTVAWELPRNGFTPLLISTVSADFTGFCDCNTGGPQPIVVGPYPYPQPKNNPAGVRWPDYVELPAVGMTSLLCPGPVSTSESTWGGIKALYR